MVTLFSDKNKCCACSACINICPTHAISLKPDEDGFVYPNIDETVCIECGLCNKVCAYQNVLVNNNLPLETYVAINKNEDILLSSSSGGVFGALASLVFERKGVVFGCAYNNDMEPKHICIDSSKDLGRIQGSKYVQSDINNSYSEVREYLKGNRWVLFTGTPCQIAGLKMFLGKDYYTLITADIICHGVPSSSFFKGYIKYLDSILGGEIVDIKFRDKSKGWGHTERVYYKQNGIIKDRLIQPFESYYHSYFLSGDILRENCYECKYACSSREGDFTMGDYWGIEKAHPEIKKESGVSVFLVNSQKGKLLVDELMNYFYLTKSDFSKARMQNGTLNKPTRNSVIREKILETWREGGHQAVATEYYKTYRKKIMIYRLKGIIPKAVKDGIKKIFV
jgi:coenzyme F420-reducing hydrogenase beta subunit